MKLDWAIEFKGYQKIIELSKIQDTWNGKRIPRFSQSQIDLAMNLYTAVWEYAQTKQINFIYIEPKILPCSDGEIEFIWGRDNPRKFDQPCVLILYVLSKKITELRFLDLDETRQLGYLKASQQGISEGYTVIAEISTFLDWILEW